MGAGQDHAPPMGGRLHPPAGWRSPCSAPPQIDQRLARRPGPAGGPSPAGRRCWKALREVTDLERLIGRVVYGTAGCRDLAALCRQTACHSCPRLTRTAWRALPRSPVPEGAAGGDRLTCEAAADLIDRAIVGRAPLLRAGREPSCRPRATDEEVDQPAGPAHKRGKGSPGRHRGRGNRSAPASQEPEGELQQGLWLLHRGRQVLRPDQAPEDYTRKPDPHQQRAVHHPGAERAGKHTILSAEDQVTALEYQLFCKVRAGRAPMQAHRIQRTAARRGPAGRAAPPLRPWPPRTTATVMPEVDLSGRARSSGRAATRWWRRC